MNTHAQSHLLQPEINSTPMLDVAFNILIFFIVAATAVPPPTIQVDQPAAATAQSVSNPKQPILIVSVANDRWYLNTEPCSSLAELRNVIQGAIEISPSLPEVQIQGHRDSPFRNIISTIDLLRGLGVSTVGLNTTAIDSNP